MRARVAIVCLSGLLTTAVEQAWAQNPFAPSAPATTPAAPATPAPPAAAPPAAGANPFAPSTPAATPAKPATPPAGAPAANPFAPSAPASTPAMPAVPGGNTPAPVVENAGQTGLPIVPEQGPPPSGGYRILAPGVLTKIPSPVTVDDLQSIHDLTEVLTALPTYGERPAVPNRKPARGIRFLHDVWGLEFAFKPVRFIQIPGADGKPRQIWYMVYNVRNGPVKRLEYDDAQESKVRAEPVTKPFLFIPRFELHSFDVDKTYVEKVIPEAAAAIQQREDKNRKLLTTGEMTGEIPVSTPEVDRTIWGVVTWEGVDPRTDRFSIIVHGLTNAFRWTDPEGGYQAGTPLGTGRKYEFQVLTLNFWRPSDTRYEHEDEIRFGIPGEVDYSWSYR